MTAVGQLCLLIAFVAAGYAAIACLAGAHRDGPRGLAISGAWAGLVGFAALSAVSGILAWALLAKDFGFAYVARYSDPLLPWHYSLSTFWVGQAGSLLLWAWFLALLSLLYRFWPSRNPSELRQPAFGILMAYLCFLVAIMVFAADPMQPGTGGTQRGEGLSPLLQHPAMLIHPPIVFLGYAAWSIPFALVLAALVSGKIDSKWIREGRSWALLAWTVLGAGILLGANWAYQELGWGGYWGWDPVENGSLIPWLAGTALIHAMLAWQYAGALKKTACTLALTTFALCNFSSFLTRSGIFSSLHAFSRSPIGWMFLVLVLMVMGGGGALVFVRRVRLTATGSLAGLAVRESLVLVAIVALMLLTVATTVGTVSGALTGVIFGHTIVVGPAFYNYVLIPTGLVLVLTTALAPLCRWGRLPTPPQKRGIRISAAAAIATLLAALAFGVRHPLNLVVAGAAAMAVAAPLGSLALDVRRRRPESLWGGLLRTLREQRRQYAGFLIHTGMVCLIVGVTGSSLGQQEYDVALREGESTPWGERTVRLDRLIQRQTPAMLVMEAELTVTGPDGGTSRLTPAQHYYVRQEEWTTEVDIASSWRGDIYGILHDRECVGPVNLKLFYNPMMRWIWFGGWIVAAGALVAIWPAAFRPGANRVVPAPKWMSRRPRKAVASRQNPDVSVTE